MEETEEKEEDEDDDEEEEDEDNDELANMAQELEREFMEDDSNSNL